MPRRGGPSPGKAQRVNASHILADQALAVLEAKILGGGGSLEGWRGEAPGGGPKISYLGGV